MRHWDVRKTAYFQLKNVIFNTNSILIESVESRSEAREEGASDHEIVL